MEGLKLINRLGLPHPEWQFVKCSDELNIDKIQDYVGWTIRTVAFEDPLKKWKNVFDNWVPKRKVGAIVDDFQSQLDCDAIFVVYPSWKWRKAGAILSEGTRMTLEGVYGTINDLSRRGIVDARFSYRYHVMELTHGDKQFFTHSERDIAAHACRQIMGKNLIVEFAITSQNKFIFFRLEKIEEAAKLLMEKYGRQKNTR